jgi:large subunit ribosomal protein L2
MGKRIIPRARGKGGPRYVSPSQRFLGRVEYVTAGTGYVKDIVDDPGRSAPVAIVKFENGKEVLHIAAEGLRVGDLITYDGNPSTGNVVQLAKIPEGAKIFCVETYPGSGPKMCRSSGVFAMVVGKRNGIVTVHFPSGKSKDLNENCRASIGVPAGGGRGEKPFVKAGKKTYAMLARGRLYPRSKGSRMTPTDHPYGGRQHRPRPNKSVSRNAPPGAKVGSISPRRMGKRKGK